MALAIGTGFSASLLRGVSKTEQLKALGGATFIKDYQSTGTLNADYSLGSPTASFTATRQATNSTEVGDDGIIRAADTAVNRKNNYYDATGFHARSGVLLEAASTNLLIRTDGTDSGSGLWTGWIRGGTVSGTPVVSQVAVTSLTNVSGSNAQRLQYTAVSGDVSDDMRLTSSNTANASIALNNTLTVSAWIRTQTANTGVSIKLRITSRTAADAFIANYDSSALSIDSTWKRFSFTTQITDATVDHVSGTVGALGDVADGDVVDFEIWDVQLETGSTATSFIPTTTAAVTRAADAPSTYVDANGLIQINATNNTPRYQGGYYDATGFHAGNKGVMVEGAITNLIPKSSTIDDATWTETNTVANNADAGSTTPFGDATSPSLTASADNGTLLLTTNVTAQTYSVWLKRKTGTGAVTITADGTNYSSALDVTTAWRRFSVTAASAAQKCGIKLATNTDAVYVWGNQFEASPYMTSHVPSAGAAMSRTGSKDSHVSSGNRTNTSETTLIKYAPSWAAASQTSAVYLLDSDSNIVDLAFVPASDSFQYRPNGTTDAANVALADSDPAINTSSVIAVVSYGATAATNAEIYVDGVSKGSTTTNYTQPTIGTNFYIGSKADGTLQLGGVVQSIATFSRALTAAEIVSATAVMNS